MIPDLERWVRAGIQNLELMKYLFAKGVNKEYVRTLFKDIVSVCDSELLQVTMTYLEMNSLAGRDYLLERNLSRAYIHLLHSLNGRVCKYSVIDLVEACCRDKKDDPTFLQEMLTFYGIEVVHVLNREWFDYEVIPNLIDKGNLRILAFCIQHRADYTPEGLPACYNEEEEDELELRFEEYNLSKLSTYQREKLDFYLAQ